jgi:hypothetical protein
VTPKNQKALSILRTPEQSEAQASADAALNPAVNAAIVVSWPKGAGRGLGAGRKSRSAGPETDLYPFFP